MTIVPDRERPRVAARRAAEPASAAGEYLSFRLGIEEYGIDIMCVQEIRSYGAPTRIANAPDFVKGVIDLRGVIVPIVDLRLKFGLEDASYDTLTVVVILNLGRQVFGVVVDAVSGVVQLMSEQVRPVPEFSQMVDDSFLRGIASIAGRESQPDRMLMLVDIERLLSSSGPGLVGSSCWRSFRCIER
ncbi:MAG: chemotaxis protein CheW [Burkholderiaceae bacterium]|nr:chemotaxis protein CheW [Burkholderiaceae bacterium]